MVKRIGTFRSNTRYKLKKPSGTRGKISLTKYFQEIAVGEKVCLKAEPAYQNGMYHPRFHGKIGVTKGLKGRCYEVIIKDFNKVKTVVVHPVHLQKVK